MGVGNNCCLDILDEGKWELEITVVWISEMKENGSWK